MSGTKAKTDFIDLLAEKIDEGTKSHFSELLGKGTFKEESEKFYAIRNRVVNMAQECADFMQDKDNTVLSLLSLSKEAIEIAEVLMDDTLEKELNALVRAGKKIMAIKAYRKATGEGLKESKDYIEKEFGHLMPERREPDPPPKGRWTSDGEWIPEGEERVDDDTDLPF